MDNDNHFPETSDDDFLSGAVVLRQPIDGYRAGTDAVLLAACVEKTGSKASQRWLDMGAGVGAVGLAVASRITGVHITAIEKDPFCAELLKYNISANSSQACMRALCGDVTQMPSILKGSFDQVFANPPFHHPADQPPQSRRRHLAHNGDGPGLDKWIESGLWALKARGRMTFIIRADRTDEALVTLRNSGAGEILLYPIWSYADSPAIRMVITARKDVKGTMALLPGLVLHRPTGALTSIAQKVMKGEGLGLVHPAARHLHKSGQTPL